MLNLGTKAVVNGLDAATEKTAFQPEQLSRADLWEQLLERYWGGFVATGEQTILTCRVKRLYYKPEKGTCRVYLNVKVGSANGRFLGEQILFAHLLPSTEIQHTWQAVQAQHWAQPAFGPPVFLIPEPSIIVWAYPNDPHLPGLPLLSNKESVLSALRTAPEAYGLACNQQAVTIEQTTLTKYVAGQRCGYIYDIGLEDDTTHRVYAKAYRAKAGTAAAAVWQQVWNSPARERGELSMPEPYSYDLQHHILWQEMLEGQPLAKILHDVDLAAVTADAGRQLAALHSLALDVPSGITLEHEKGQLAKSLTAVSRAFPRAAARCQQLYERLLSDPETLQKVNLVPIHASFKPSHLLVANDRCSLIDFDGTVLGDAAYDLGRFIAHLRGAESKDKLDADTVNHAVAALCQAYNQAASRPVAQSRMNWFAASLILSSHINKVVKRMLKTHDQFGADHIDRLLSLAEQTLSEELAYAQ